MSPSKLRILKASAELIAQIGYDKVTIDKIASAAAVSKATIYKNFQNKDDILGSYISFELQGVPKELGAIIQSSGPIDYVLPRFAEEYVLYISRQETIDLFKVFIGFAGRVQADSRAYYHLLPNEIVETLVRRFEFWARGGKISCSDPEILASQFLGMTRGVVYPRIIFDPDFVIDDAVAKEIATQATNVLLHGVGVEVQYAATN